MAGNILALAVAAHRVPFEANSAHLGEALAIVCREVEVVANSAVAVLRKAVASACVPVEIVFTRLVRSTEAFTSEVIEVFAVSTGGCWVFDALASTVFNVPNREVHFFGAVLREATASADVAIPVESFTAKVDGRW